MWLFRCRRADEVASTGDATAVHAVRPVRSGIGDAGVPRAQGSNRHQSTGRGASGRVLDCGWVQRRRDREQEEGCGR